LFFLLTMAPHSNDEAVATLTVADFDVLVERSLKDLSAEYESVAESCKKLIHIKLMMLTKDVRKEKVSNVFLRKEQPKKDSLATEINNAVAQTVQKVQSAVEESTAKKARTARKRATVTQTPMESVRKSSRKRTTTNPFETPSLRGRRNLPMMTPLITPKFDMSTPLNRSVFRGPRPDETLVSLSGSPVNPVVSGGASSRPVITTSKKAHRAPKGVDTSLNVPIKLARGNTLIVPMEATDGNDAAVQLDDEAIRKLEALQSNITNLLKNSQH